MFDINMHADAHAHVARPASSRNTRSDRKSRKINGKLKANSSLPWPLAE